MGLGLPSSSKQNHGLGFKRYAANREDGFQPHFDSMYDKSDRYLVFLWYLNDVAEGGETRFTDLDFSVQAPRTSIDVSAVLDVSACRHATHLKSQIHHLDLSPVREDGRFLSRQALMTGTSRRMAPR